MDVDGCAMAHHGGVTLYLLLPAAGREPGKDPTTGDMIRLGQIFRDRVLGTDQLLVACQLDAEKDANRRRNEDHEELSTPPATSESGP